MHGAGVGEGEIAVVIPCYDVEDSIEGVLRLIGPEVSAIYCVDDASSDGTAEAVRRRGAEDPRVVLVPRERNGGVGAATVTGMSVALERGWTVIVKIDADGQMDPGAIPEFAAPIVAGTADYVKGNRFFSLETLRGMPWRRIVGNAGVSFLSKASTGYWHLFDPTNGFTAIHADVARALPLSKLHPRYFFETDLLFRLNTIRARVVELPIPSTYGLEHSHLSEVGSLFTFPLLHLRNTLKRLVYGYFLRNFSLASLSLVVGVLLIAAGGGFGLVRWWQSIESGQPATAGTVMLAALPFLVGVQLVLSFLAYDMSMIPTEPIQRGIRGVLEPRGREGGSP